MTSIKSINPYNNQILNEYKELNQEELEECLQRSNKAFLSWKRKSFSERATLMHKCGDLLEHNKEELGKMITKEMGKPISQSFMEVEKCALTCYYYAENAAKFLEEDNIESDAFRSYISYEPLGCILAIMPWNFPFWQVFRFAAPTIMAGNTAILKHASNVPQCALAIEKIFKDAGFEDGVFKTVLIGASRVKFLIEHPIVKAVTLTGSEKAGEDVGMLAGKNLKKSVLELGGSDCFIVLSDADIQYAAEIAVSSRMINNGQSCIAAKRFIIVKEVYDKFLQLMKFNMEKLKLGDPLNPVTTLGPLARTDLAKQLHKQVESTLKAGAKLFYGGGMPEMDGAFYNPTILTELDSTMPGYNEEFFGPVALVFKAEDERDAIRIANDSPFGLGGSIWTKDVEKGILLSKEIESGAVFVNGLVKSDPRLPFGGIKRSGYGRELSYIGIHEFVNIKTVWIK